MTDKIEPGQPVSSFTLDLYFRSSELNLVFSFKAYKSIDELVKVSLYIFILHLFDNFFRSSYVLSIRNSALNISGKMDLWP